MCAWQKRFRFGDFEIGEGVPPFVVAELSGNHNGNFSRAIELADAAIDAGAHAIKLQTYTPDTMTIRSDSPPFMIDKGPWSGRNLYDLYETAHTPWDWHAPLFEHVTGRGCCCFSTPFDLTSLELLEELECPLYKIASFEIVDLALIRAVAATGKPMVMSTGMSSDEEISEAVAAAAGAGCTSMVLLHCVSGYPTPIDQVRARSMLKISDAFDVPVGISDHTLGTLVPVVCVSMGACFVEKHVTLRRSDGGPDAGFSLEPAEFAEMLEAVGEAWKILGKEGDTARPPCEDETRSFRRSLFFVESVRAGEIITSESVRSIRPGDGIPPKFLDEVVGKRASRDITKGTPVGWDLVREDDA